MCGSNDLLKQDGVFVCQTCGTKYSVEEARKMMVEGTVAITGSVKVDVSEKVQNLYVMARRARDENNAELASKYYEMITMEDPNDWEALFYFNYFKAKNTNLRDLSSSVYHFNKSLNSVFEAIEKSDKNSNEKWAIAEEIIARIDNMCELFIRWAKSHYREYSSSNNSISELRDRANAVADLQKKMADLLEQYFAGQSEKARIAYLKSYIENYLLLDTLDSEFAHITLKYYSDELIEAENRIKVIEPDYKSLIDELNHEKKKTEEPAKEPQDNEAAYNMQNDGGMIQVNYQVGHYDVSNQWYFYPNSAGGNTVRYAIKNIGTKPIKYYHLCFVPYNAVGDKVECSISNDSYKWVKGTGPIVPNGFSGERFFENAWYNHSIKSVKLVKAEIEYMDGTKQTIQGEQITPIGGSKGSAKARSISMSQNVIIGALLGSILGGILGIFFCKWATSVLATASSSLRTISPGEYGIAIIVGFGAPLVLAAYFGARIGSSIDNKKAKRDKQQEKQEGSNEQKETSTQDVKVKSDANI